LTAMQVKVFDYISYVFYCTLIHINAAGRTLKSHSHRAEKSQTVSCRR
jgi:hypothetical protein